MQRATTSRPRLGQCQMERLGCVIKTHDRRAKAERHHPANRLEPGLDIRKRVGAESFEPRQRIQPQPDLRDDAEGSLTADEQLY